MSLKPQAKPKYVVLQEFTAIVRKHDPMGIGSNAPVDEYEAEALSILARFCEAGLIASVDPAATLTYATLVVEQTMAHWFGDLKSVCDVGALVKELLEVYVASYPVQPLAIG